MFAGLYEFYLCVAPSRHNRRRVFARFPSRDPRPRRRGGRRVETRHKPIFNQVAAVAFERRVNETNQKPELMVEANQRVPLIWIFSENNSLHMQSNVQKMDCMKLPN